MKRKPTRNQLGHNSTSDESRHLLLSQNLAPILNTCCVVISSALVAMAKAPIL